MLANDFRGKAALPADSERTLGETRRAVTAYQHLVAAATHRF